MSYFSPCYIHDNGMLHLVGYIFLLSAPEQFKLDFESRFNEGLSGDQTVKEMESFESNWIREHMKD